MTLGARLLERANHIRRAMQVRIASRRDRVPTTARAKTSEVMPTAERLEDRLLLSNTLIDMPTDYGLPLEPVGDQIGTVQAVDPEDGPVFPVADNLSTAEGGIATILDSEATTLLASHIGLEAVPDPDEVSWASVRNLTNTQFQNDFEARKADNILIDMEVNEIDGQQIFSGVWQKNTDGRSWYAHHNLTSSQFGAQWNQYDNDGYRLIDQESYALGNQQCYAGIWVKNLEGYEWASYRNVTGSEFSDRYEYYEEQYIPIDFDAYTSGSATRYAAAWVENSDALEWVLRRDLTRIEFGLYLSLYDNLYRVHDIESYQVGGQQRYAAIWIENHNGRGSIAARAMNAQEYSNRWLRYRDLGYRLTDFEQYETGDGMRYAGVWRQNTDRPDWHLRSAIDALAESHLNAENIPGMSVAVVSQGDIKYMRGFGHQDVANDLWYSAHTVNRLASVSKAIAGVLLYKLDGDPEIELNASALTSTYVGTLPTLTPINHTHTLSQLASNSGGIDGYLPSGDPNRLLPHYTQYDTALDAAPLFWNRPLVSVPGTAYKYSTHGYTLLGAAIEGAVGQAIDDVLYNELGGGLGLTTLKAEDRSVPNWFRTKLYDHNAATANTEATADNISWKILGGGMEASAYDLARFSDMLMGGQILSGDLDSGQLLQLWTVPSSNTNYAMGWNVSTQQGHVSVEKAGQQLGADTYVQLFPALDLGIVVLNNLKYSNTGDLSRDIADAILTGAPGVGAYVELNPFGDATVNNTLDNSMDTDVFAFAFDNTGNTQIDVDDHGGSLNAGLRLWDLEDGVIVAVDSDSIGDDPQITESLVRGKLYAAEIFSENSSGDFTLSIDGPTGNIGNVALNGDGDATLTTWSIDATASNADIADYCRFVAPTTTTGSLALTLTPDAGSGLDGVLTLYDSAGVQLLRADSGSAEVAETISYSGAVAGETYYARIGAYKYKSDGHYTLDIDFDLPLPTTWSASVEGFATMHRDGFSHDVLSFDAKINFAGDIDSYYFASDTTGTVTIGVDDFGNDVDPLVAIYNASTGALLGWDDDSGSDDNARVSVDISNHKRYIVAVTDANGLATGDLGITIDKPMDNPVSNIVIGIDGAGTSTAPNIQAADSDFLKFITPANTIGTGSVTVTPASTLDVEFVMFNAAGNELDRGNSSSTGNPSSFSYSSFAPNTEYYLTIHSDDYDTTGDVTLVEVDLDLYSEIHGTKFYDRDQDGIHDAGEELLSGWTIYLDENNNGIPDPGEPTTVTDENGEYAFTKLLEGTYVVREILKEGWTQTAPGPAAALLYHVDFDTPPHTVGAAPAIGEGPATRETISRIEFGTPTVIAAAGSLDQSLLFAPPPTDYEQVHFDLNNFGQTFDHYSIGMDLLVQALDAGTHGDSFTVHLDTPQIRYIVFRGDGSIEAYVPGTSAAQIGTYVKGDVLDLRLDVDLVTPLWTISMNGEVIHTGDFDANALWRMRFNLDDSGAHSGNVALDNIIIRGSDFGFTDDGHTITLGGSEVAIADFGNVSNDSTPPHVTEVLVRGNWARAYFNELRNLGLGHVGYAIPVGNGDQLDPLPFATLDELVVRFNEPVSIGIDDVRLVGVLGPDGIDNAADDYNIVDVTTIIGATGDFEAVIELDAPIATDKLLLTVFDSTVDAGFNHLDGEWTDGVSTYLSGNGDEGGDFSFRFNVLPGDLTQNGTVEGGDLSMLLGSWLQSVPPVHPLTDITGNTVMDGGDLSVLLGNWLTGLPNGTPTNGGVTITALLETSDGAGSLGRFGLGSVSQWRGDRSGPATLLQDDDDNVDLLSTTGGRAIMVDTARSLAI